MELNKTRIEDGIIRQVSEDVMSAEELRDRVKRAVDTRIDNLFKSTVDAQIKAAIEAAITKGLDHEYTRVNSFGQRDGEPTTIRAELEKQIAGYWNTKVDKLGKPDTGYGDKMTRAEWIMTQLVAADFQGEMKQHIVNLGGSLKDKLRGELHGTVNRLLTEVFHVRTADDDAAKVQLGTIHPKPTGKQ